MCEAAATDHTLSPTDQHLVLGTAAFWQLVGPADAALRAHFHEKVRRAWGFMMHWFPVWLQRIPWLHGCVHLWCTRCWRSGAASCHAWALPSPQFAQREMDRAAAEAAALAATAGLQEAPSPSLLQAANTAEHLVWWALEKATRRLTRLQGGRGAQGRRSKLPPSAADLLALPLARPPPAAEAADAAEGSPVRGSPARQQQAQQLIRGDVLAGDLGVVVITLRQSQRWVGQRLTSAVHMPAALFAQEHICCACFRGCAALRLAQHAVIHRRRP